eukprot:gene6551-43726_t
MAHKIVTEFMRKMIPDRHSVPSHTEAFADFWLADARTLQVYPVAADEIIRRTADPAHPYLWAPIDEERTSLTRRKAALPFALDGGLAGLQIGNKVQPRHVPAIRWRGVVIPLLTPEQWKIHPPEAVAINVASAWHPRLADVLTMSAGGGKRPAAAASAAAAPDRKRPHSAPAARPAPPAPAHARPKGDQKKAPRSTITAILGAPPGVQTDKPLRHPALASEYTRWKCITPSDITHIEDVTLAEAGESVRGILKHPSGWHAINEDDLLWTVRAAAPGNRDAALKCRGVPTVMLRGSAMVDSRHIQATMSRSADRNEGERLAERIRRLVRDPEQRHLIATFPDHVILDIYANSALLAHSRQGKHALPSRDTIEAVDDAALRAFALDAEPPRYLERDRLIDALLEPDDALRERIDDRDPWDPPALPTDGVDDPGTPWLVTPGDAEHILAGRAVPATGGDAGPAEKDGRSDKRQGNADEGGAAAAAAAAPPPPPPAAAAAAAAAPATAAAQGAQSLDLKLLDELLGM